MSNYKILTAIPIDELMVYLKESNYVISETLRKLNLSHRDTRCRKYLQNFIIDNNLSQHRKRYKRNVADVKNAIRKSICFADVCRELGLIAGSGNNETIKRIIKNENIDISHFESDVAIKRRFTYGKTMGMSMFTIDSKVSQSVIRRYILNNALIPYNCDTCKITEYNAKSITLTLDHKNGINNDHRLENLRFMCPNCDSQGDTYCGKNTKRREEYFRK